MAKKKYYDGHYSGMDSRMKMEGSDSGMIASDYSAPANLPQQPILKEYPKYTYTGYEGLDDTSKGIDVQTRDDNKEKKRETYPEKY